MIQILTRVQKYVPSKTIERNLVLPNKDTISYEEEHYAVTLIGGDQLTVACARGAQRILAIQLRVKTGFMVYCQSLNIGMQRCASYK